MEAQIGLLWDVFDLVEYGLRMETSRTAVNACYYQMRLEDPF